MGWRERLDQLRNLDHLWLVGLALWGVATVLLWALLPKEPGPYRLRPFATALFGGILIALVLIGLDLSRGARPWWLWGLFLWTGMVSLSGWDAAVGDDPDIDQIIGIGVVFATVLAFPFLLVSAIGFVWKEGERQVRERPRRWKLEVKGNSVELKRSREPEE